MKILILGGTGVLSYDFTLECIGNNDEVWVLNRNNKGTLEYGNVHNIKMDIKKLTGEQCDLLFGSTLFDAVIDFLSYTLNDIRQHVAVLGRRTRQYVFISSAVAYIKNSDDIISEDKFTVGNPKWDYGFQKALCEKWLSEQNMEYLIIRPYVTFGKTRIPFQFIPNNYNYTLIARVINNKPVAMIDDGKAICTLTDTRDFASVLYRLIFLKNATRDCFHITSGFETTWHEVYSMMCKILDRKENPFNIALSDVKKYMPKYYEMLYGDKATNWRFDNRKVIEKIGGYDFKYTIYESLENSINYFCNNSFMQGIDFLWDGEVDHMLRMKGYSGDLNCLENNSYSSRRYLYKIVRSEIGNDIYNNLRRIKRKITRH